MSAEPHNSIQDRRHGPATLRLETAVACYLDELTKDFLSKPAPGLKEEAGRSGLAEQIFAVLTSRTFCYMGRTQSLPYRESTLTTIRRDTAARRPARFFFDLGPGYHASLEPGENALVFDVGLAEFLALRQVKRFDLEVQAIYAPGVKFFLVIDNLCGLYTNDVPLEQSTDYVRGLRQLIAQLDLDDTVEVLVESEAFNTAEYEALLAAQEPSSSPHQPTEEDIENVARFLGRRCSPGDASDRIERYHLAGQTTEALLSRVVDGVRLTQRATAATLGFRSFPGGAQRVQVGEIAVAINNAESTRPVLITSRNRDRYDVRPLDVKHILPAPITTASYVRLLPQRDRRQRRKS